MQQNVFTGAIRVNMRRRMRNERRSMSDAVVKRSMCYAVVRQQQQQQQVARPVDECKVVRMVGGKVSLARQVLAPLLWLLLAPGSGDA
jgi:4-hydroxy-3-methylbut-2-enyl diphosphate reductase IspH